MFMKLPPSFSCEKMIKVNRCNGREKLLFLNINEPSNLNCAQKTGRLDHVLHRKHLERKLKPLVFFKLCSITSPD